MAQHPSTTSGTSRGPGRTLVVYTVARFGLFLVCAAVFYACGMGLLWAMVFAAALSSVAGWFLLSRQRLALSSQVADRVDQARRRSAERTAREDVIADEMIAAEQGKSPPDP